MLAFLVRPYVSAWQHRELLKALSSREIRGTFAGSMLGAAWVVLQPLCSLAVYALVFGRALGFGGGGGMPFVSSLFAGMIVFQVFSETVSRAPRLVLARANFVTKVAFPLDVLPWPVASLAAVHAVTSTALLVVLHWLLVAPPAWTAVLLPVVLLPALLLGLGLGWLLAAVGVYVRDTQDVVRVVLQLLFFSCPIVWTLADLKDEGLAAATMLNPLAVIMEAMRDSLTGSSGRGALPVLATTVLAVLVAALGHRFFQRVRSGFADVM